MNTLVLKDSEPVSLEVVRDEPRKKLGRPVRLTVRKFIRICRLVESGHTFVDACEIECVTYQTFRFRVSHSPRLEQRVKQAEAIRSLKRHDEALAAVVKAGERNWVAHAWYLERVHPELYALRKIERAAIEQVAGVEEVRIIGMPASEIDKLEGPEFNRLPSGNVERHVGGVKVIYARIA
jgi:hypothetical protein